MGRADALTPSRHKGSYTPLPREELPVDTLSLARYLIGKILVRELPEGIASGVATEPACRLGEEEKSQDQLDLQADHRSD
jgi:3-methyladenine DNA glycosylase Mpg